MTEQQALNEWEISVVVLKIQPATPARLQQIMPRVKERLPEVAGKKTPIVIR